MRNLAVLKAILSQPTAPFRERYVMSTVEQILNDSKVPFFYDEHGNMLIGVESEVAMKKVLAMKTNVPFRLLMAHTDHPGFHGVRWLDDATLAIKWFGGSPKKHLNNAKVWLADSLGNMSEGRLRKVKLAGHGFSIDRAEVKLLRPLSEGRHVGAKKVYGGFDFRASFWRSGNTVYTRAADDLVGVYCIVEAMKNRFLSSCDKAREKGQPSFVGLLTRAEEVGFVGALAHFNLDWYASIKRPFICVSLEASRTLTGAEIGKGPVVRLGDRRTVFSADALQSLTMLADKHLKGGYQRRIMDGGACEGSATMMKGFSTVGISIPLGNYHNEAYEGGPDSRGRLGPAPEFVNLKDIDRMLQLCIALGDDGAWDNPWQTPWARLDKNFQAMKKLL